MLKAFAWIFTILCAVLLVTGLLIIYVINTGKGFPFWCGSYGDGCADFRG